MRGCGLCWDFWASERERCYKGGEGKPFSLAFVRPGEDDDEQCHQNDIVCSSFF